jgi:hypothetical protein
MQLLVTPRDIGDRVVCAGVVRDNLSDGFCSYSRTVKQTGNHLTQERWKCPATAVTSHTQRTASKLAQRAE